MHDPDCAIEANGIQAVVYTPTAQSGLDIQAKFDRGLLISNAVLPPTQMLQMLGRCRKCPEWFVSAPRQSTNPSAIAPSLDGKKVRAWTEQIKQSFAEFGFSAIDKTQGWAVWERLTGEIEKAFNSEYLHALLKHFFASVETIEVESTGTGAWRESVTVIKDEDAEKTLKANLEKGLKLKTAQKQASKNSQVWDLKLAEFWTKYPAIAERAISALGTTQSDDAIEMSKIMTSSRVERLKNWVGAIDEINQDDRDLIDHLKSKPIHYAASNFKRLQNLATGISA
jgi:hypothetical protein